MPTHDSSLYHFIKIKFSIVNKKKRPFYDDLQYLTYFVTRTIVFLPEQLHDGQFAQNLKELRTMSVST